MKPLKILCTFLLIYVVCISGCLFSKNKEKFNTTYSYNCSIYNNSKISNNESFYGNTPKLSYNNGTLDDKLNNAPSTLKYDIVSYGLFGSKYRSCYYYYEGNKTVIVINLGEKPTVGYRIRIINVTKIEDNITIYYKVIPPKNITVMIITYPYLKLAVDGKYRVTECIDLNSESISRQVN